MKFLLAIAMILLIPFRIYSEACCPSVDLEIRGAEFFSSNHKFRKIYGNCPTVQLEASFPVFCSIKSFANITFFSKEGHSTPLKDHTHLKMVPVTFGLKYYVDLPCNFFGYIGGGASYTWVHIHNHSSFVKSKINDHRFGGVAKIGLGYRYNCFFATIFADYFFQKVRIHPHKKHQTDISGTFVGASLGIQF